MQIWIHDNKMKKIVALNNDISDMLSYTNSSWHSYLDQATSTFDFTIPKFSNGELHEDLKLINDECFVSFYVNGSYQVFYIATLQEDDFNIQLTCNNTNLEYALEYANPFNSSDGAQPIEWYLNHMDLLSFAAVEIGINEISDRKRTLTFDSQETKMNRLQSLMSNFDAEFEFKVELNRDGTYKRIVINIYQEADDTHHGIGTDRKDVVLYYSNGLKGVQVSSNKTQMFNAAVFTGKDGLSLNDVEISEKNADGIEEFYSRKGNPCLYAPIAMNRYPATMRAEGQDNWIRKDFTTEYENVNDLKAYALRTLKKYAYPLITYTASVQSSFVSHYTDLKLGDTIRIIDKNFVGGLALEARVSEMIISFDNPANNSFVFTNYRKLDNKPSSALQTRIEQAVESKLPYRIELATTGGVTFKNNEGETIVKPSLYKGNLPYTKDVTWRWALDGVVTDGMQYLVKAKDIDDTAVLTVSGYIGNKEVATTEVTVTNMVEPTTLVVKTSNGNIFKNNLINTKLTATLWRGGKEIDQDGSMYTYIWTKTDDDGEPDTLWNQTHSYSQKTIGITQNDVFRRAQFECNVEPLS
ncbi:phage tail protein [uncultured Streptococcus sp.]|uniref:phage tail protein n=1 Tax=uncultured Streptococcus sp. TaxID=83427 RepID=UPI0025F9FD7A|nr:phage tail protein [uncultured Streptococcus sp.]